MNFTSKLSTSTDSYKVMNPLIGDKAFGGSDATSSPASRMDMTEVDKVKLHLTFVLEQLKVSNHYEKGNGQVKDRRTKLLSALEKYIETGRFPKHEDGCFSDERKPCFLDSGGTPCAVAHIMQESGPDGELLADAIASSHKHHTIHQIAQDYTLSPAITSWMGQNGFQLSELAVIQPTYEFVAASCRRKFESIISKLKPAVEESNASLDDSELHSVARAIIKFGDEMKSGFGYPQADIPQYLSTLNDLKVPSDMVKVQKLVSNLRNEVEGKLMKPADYEGLLEEQALIKWEQSDGSCYNRRSI